MREHDNLPRVAWTEDLFHRKDIVPFGALDEEDSVVVGFEKDMSAGQASVICRKSDEQRDLENTKATTGRVELHDPLTNPNIGGMSEPFAKLIEGIAYNGDG
eukprot:4291380-Karenia_brevis.AAC.1